MIVAGPPRAAVFECNRRCGSRFVREAWDVERDRDARAVREACAGRWHRDGAAHRCGAHTLAEARR